MANGVAKPLDGCPSSESTSPISILRASGAWDLVADEKIDKSAVEVMLVPANDLCDPSPSIELPSSKLASAPKNKLLLTLGAMFSCSAHPSETELKKQLGSNSEIEEIFQQHSSLKIIRL